MARFLIRSVISTVVTMFLVSILLFVFLEVGTGDITIKILGVFSTPEQRASFANQLGLDAPAYRRYLDWLIGSDHRAQRKIGYKLVAIKNPNTQEQEWWAEVDGELVRWRMEDGELVALVRQPDGSTQSRAAGDMIWRKDDLGNEIFWGVDSRNNAAKWVRGAGAEIYVLTKTGMRTEGDAPVDYIPLTKGLLRGDAGMSLQTGRPVRVTLVPRVRNTLVLALSAFVVVMPLALALGILAGVKEGRSTDRIITVAGLAFAATPEFVTGIFLILIFGIWLKWLPAVSIFLTSDAVFRTPKMLILPVLTLAAVELGYVARMTRASMVEVMDSPYIRTAIIKGLPFRRVVLRHAVPNALLAPITVIMLHVNWLIGGIVVVEAIFGYPGLGNYIYNAAVFGDYKAVAAAAMLMVLVAVGTRLIGDLLYTFLNPRIRYS
ncbi:MAG: ABC transporter permease [Caldilineaceae bacterium]